MMRVGTCVEVLRRIYPRAGGKGVRSPPGFYHRAGQDVRPSAEGIYLRAGEEALILERVDDPQHLPSGGSSAGRVGRPAASTFGRVVGGRAG